jgi:hypothetical protein
VILANKNVSTIGTVAHMLRVTFPSQMVVFVTKLGMWTTSLRSFTAVGRLFICVNKIAHSVICPCLSKSDVCFRSQKYSMTFGSMRTLRINSKVREGHGLRVADWLLRTVPSLPHPPSKNAFQEQNIEDLHWTLGPHVLKPGDFQGLKLKGLLRSDVSLLRGTPLMPHSRDA